MKKQIEETILAKEIADKNIENHNEYIKTSELLECVKKEKNLQVYKGELEKNIPLLEELERFESDIENGEKTLSTFIVKLQEKESDLEIKKGQRDNLIKERLEEKIEEFKSIENDKKKIEGEIEKNITLGIANNCLLYTSPSPRD